MAEKLLKSGKRGAYVWRVFDHDGFQNGWKGWDVYSQAAIMTVATGVAPSVSKAKRIANQVANLLQLGAVQEGDDDAA